MNTALLSYRFNPGLELAVGRDQLPTGINIPDYSYFIRSRNRLGYYDAPTQAKLFWWSKRFLVAPYVYAPGGNEKKGQVSSPYREHLDALRLDLTFRIASQFTISAGPRIQKDEITGRISKSVVVQIALKTVH